MHCLVGPMDRLCDMHDCGLPHSIRQTYTKVLLQMPVRTECGRLTRSPVQHVTTSPKRSLHTRMHQPVKRQQSQLPSRSTDPTNKHS